jgi:hypothetical protein
VVTAITTSKYTASGTVSAAISSITTCSVDGVLAKAKLAVLIAAEN